MTRYIAAYDTESTACLVACRQIVELHRRHQMPATFFIVGKILEAHTEAYRDLLDDPLFEVASHTYSHRLIRDHPLRGQAPSPSEVREEILRSKEVVERVFDRPCLGFRPAVGFAGGLRGATDPLRWVREAGYSYVSSSLWGPDYSLPVPLDQGFAYTEDGHPDIWELPGHGWHENLLKNHNGWGPRRLILWPLTFPAAAIPAGFLHTPEEEAAVNRVFLEEAVRQKLNFVSLIWHPWSLYRFDPKMQMIDLTFAAVEELGMIGSRYIDVYQDRVGEAAA